MIIIVITQIIIKQHKPPVSKINTRDNLNADMIKKTKTSIILALAAITQSIGIYQALAQIVITDFSITDSSVSLSFTGTVGGAEPPADHRQFYLLPNNDSLAWSDPTIDTGVIDFPDSNVGSISVASRSSSAIQIFDNGIPALNLVFSPSGGPNIGDVASGSLESTWTAGTFNPAVAQTETWSLLWGKAANNIRGGTFQSTVSPVPEPSDYALIAGLGLLTYALWQRHGRSNRRSMLS